MELRGVNRKTFATNTLEVDPNCCEDASPSRILRGARIWAQNARLGRVAREPGVHVGAKTSAPDRARETITVTVIGRPPKHPSPALADVTVGNGSRDDDRCVVFRSIRNKMTPPLRRRYYTIYARAVATPRSRQNLDLKASLTTSRADVNCCQIFTDSQSSSSSSSSSSLKVRFAAWPTSWRPPGADRLSPRRPELTLAYGFAVDDNAMHVILVQVPSSS